VLRIVSGTGKSDKRGRLSKRHSRKKRYTTSVNSTNNMSISYRYLYSIRLRFDT